MNRVDSMRRRLEDWLRRRQGGNEAAVPPPVGPTTADAPVDAHNLSSVAQSDEVSVGPNAAAEPAPAIPDARAASWAAGTVTGLIDALPEPALLVDADGLLLHHNGGAMELFPRARVGQHVSQVTRAPELLAAIDQVLDSYERAVVDLVDRVPVQRKLAATVTKVVDDDMPMASGVLLITFRDLTEQERHTRMRADFVANASHELRTPLASMRGLIETLQGAARNDPVAQQRFMTMMAHEAGRMSRLIDDLLTLSRVEMRAHLPPRDIVDLNELADFVATSLELLAQAEAITIHVVALDGAAEVRGDREELIQLLQNLVQNAIKYGRHGGRVEIRVAAAPPTFGRDRIAILVTDDGQGIAEEHLPRLTERFYRVSTATSRARGGTGLGLAIVKHIVSRHHGELEIVSELAKGSTFRVVLDAADVTAEKRK